MKVQDLILVTSLGMISYLVGVSKSKRVKEELVELESMEVSKKNLEEEILDLTLEKIKLDNKVAKVLELDDGLTRVVYQYSYSSDLRDLIESKFFLRDFRYVLRDSIVDLLNKDIKAEPLIREPSMGKVKQSSMSFTTSQYTEICKFIEDNNLTKREFIDLALLDYLKNYKSYSFNYDD